MDFIIVAIIAAIIIKIDYIISNYLIDFKLLNITNLFKRDYYYYFIINC